MARLAWKRVIRKQLKENKQLRKLLVITTGDRAEEVVRGLRRPYRDYLIEGVALYDGAEPEEKEEANDPAASEQAGAEKILGIPVVANRAGVIPYIQKNVVDEVFIDLKENDKEAERLMNLFVGMGLTVHINLMRFSEAMVNKTIHSVGNYTVLSSSMKFASPRQILVKRVMDICGALVGLVIAGIAYLIFAPIIKKQSPGPAFFSQERVGRNGRTFKIYKFRTMYMDAEERKKELMDQNKMQGFMFKMDDDPRIIPIGHFLRKSSIDELPQFWNILKGEMSLVGTRPPTVDEYKQYEVQHRKRLAMKPGLTGMWQVSGRSDIVDFEEVVALDAKYIEEWDIRMDVKILWKTVLIVLGGDGAV